MGNPETAGQLLELLLLDLYPDIPVARDKELAEYLGVFPSFRIHEGISRVRIAAAGTHCPRMQEQLQIDFWQEISESTPEDPSVMPAIEQALDDFVSARIGPGGTVMRLVADGPGHRAFNPLTSIAQDLMTVTATIQPASAQLVGA